MTPQTPHLFTLGSPWQITISPQNQLILTFLAISASLKFTNPFSAPQGSPSSKYHFLLVLTRKRRPGEFASFRSSLPVPRGNWATGSAPPTPLAVALQVGSVRGGGRRGKGRQGKVFCGGFSVFLSVPRASEPG